MKMPANELMLDKINAMVDGQLAPGELAEVMGQLTGNAESLETLHAWQTQREALRAMHRPLPGQEIPANLLSAAARYQHGRQQLDQWWRRGAMAAGVMLAFGVGWILRGQFGNPSSQALASGAAPASGFVHQASLAHAVFSPEVLHPVEVTAAQQEHLVQWLSKRLGKPLKVPQLASQGYELVGGRLLPGGDGARAQFMFQNPAGLRVTLYLGATGDRQANASSGSGGTLSSHATTGSDETAFKYSAEGPVASFYWVDQGFGYALSGAVQREELMKLAQLVYRQL
jgi:anti-sigma factor RsiW